MVGGSACFEELSQQNEVLLKDELQKLPSRAVLKKSYSKNMHQIYRRTPMSKCDFNKVVTSLKSHFDMGVLL